jgi:hypothetical protein
VWSWYLASRAVCLLLLVPESAVLSDITYFARVLAETGAAGALPEYPWPAVALLDLPRLAGAAQGAPYHLALLGLFAAIDAAFAGCLWRAGGRRMTRGMVLWIALGPLLGPLVLARFDTLAGAALALALLALASRPAAAGALVALGAGIKLFPVLGLPALLLPGGWGRRAAVAAGAAAAGLGLAAWTVHAAGWERLWAPLGFQGQRGLHVEAFAALPFLWARHLGLGDWESRLGACRCYELHGPGIDLALQGASVGLALGALGLGLLFWRAARAGTTARTPALAARLTILALVLFIATNKVFSPQYLVWLAAPLAVLALLPGGGLARADLALLLGACAATHVIFPLNYAALSQVESSRAWVLLLLAARDAALVALGARLAAQVWRATLKTEPA